MASIFSWRTFAALGETSVANAPSFAAMERNATTPVSAITPSPARPKATIFFIFIYWLRPVGLAFAPDIFYWLRPVGLAFAPLMALPDYSESSRPARLRKEVGNQIRDLLDTIH